MINNETEGQLPTRDIFGNRSIKRVKDNSQQVIYLAKINKETEGQLPTRGIVGERSIMRLKDNSQHGIYLAIDQ
jgi:hypothetical protein